MGTGDFLGLRQNHVTIGNYFYDDSRFAKHPQFCFFTPNTEMRWHALQTDRICVRQHLGDAQMLLDEPRDMVGRKGENLSDRVLHFAASLRGTRQ